MLAFLAAEPALARLAMVEALAAGPGVVERYDAAIQSFVPYFHGGREGRSPEEPGPLSPTTEEALVGGMVCLISRRILAGQGEALEDLLPDLVEFLLTPYLGAQRPARSPAERPYIGPMLWTMFAQLADALDAAMLTDLERRVLERYVGRLREELGEDLRAVWLYGSRARADAVLDDSDPDRKSDVDLLVVAERGSRAGATGHFTWPSRPPSRRETARSGTRSSFTGPSACASAARSAPSSSRTSTATSCPRRERAGVSPRSEEFMEQARDRAALARQRSTRAIARAPVSSAYYAMLTPARAALSEGDRHPLDLAIGPRSTPPPTSRLKRGSSAASAPAAIRARRGGHSRSRGPRRAGRSGGPRAGRRSPARPPRRRSGSRRRAGGGGRRGRGSRQRGRQAEAVRGAWGSATRFFERLEFTLVSGAAQDLQRRDGTGAGGLPSGRASARALPAPLTSQAEVSMTSGTPEPNGFTRLQPRAPRGLAGRVEVQLDLAVGHFQKYSVASACAALLLARLRPAQRQVADQPRLARRAGIHGVERLAQLGIDGYLDAGVRGRHEEECTTEAVRYPPSRALTYSSPRACRSRRRSARSSGRPASSFSATKSS